LLSRVLLVMERGFLSQKGSVGRGVKEKQVLMADQSVKVHGIRALSCANEENINDVGTKVGPTPTGNTPCMSSYANDTHVPNRKALNFHTLFTPPGNGVDVVVPMKSIRAISEWFANTEYGFFLGKRVAYPIVANYVKNTWGKYGLVKTMLNSSTRIFFFKFSSIDGLDVMLVYGPWFIHNNPFILKKWNPDVNLLKEDVGNILVWVKLHGVSVTAFSEDSLSAIATKLGTPLMLDYYISDMCIKSWGRCACCKVFGHDLNDCPKNINTDVVKNINKPNQATRGVAVSLKVTNSNPFDMLNTVKNDVDLGTNGASSNMASKNATSIGSSFSNVEFSSTSITSIVEKIDKIKRIIIDGKLTLVDDEGKPLAKVDCSGDHDSEDEVALVDNEMANFLASKKVGYGTNSLLEQWKETYENDDYDFGPYDDAMYEGQDIPDMIQAICDNLDIKVQGRKKK
ncbi:beta-caryophyllene synthase, partial [Tanacetum coccineum]